MHWELNNARSVTQLMMPSHDCIRVPAGNAAKLFTLTRAGDRVNIIP